jgi:hypothetical protein
MDPFSLLLPYGGWYEAFVFSSFKFACGFGAGGLFFRACGWCGNDGESARFRRSAGVPPGGGFRVFRVF